MNRKRLQTVATLLISGRNQKEVELALRFDEATGIWEPWEQTEENHLSPERQEIVELFKKAPYPLRLQEIAQALGKKRANVGNLMNKLIKQGITERTSYGHYQLKGGPATGSGVKSKLVDPPKVETVADIPTAQGDILAGVAQGEPAPSQRQSLLAVVQNRVLTPAPDPRRVDLEAKGVLWKSKLKNGRGKGGQMCKLEKRLRKLEADLEQFRVNRINEGNVGVGRVGLATAEAMLTSAEFRQLVEEFIRAVPEPGLEEETGTCTKDEEASLLRSRVRLDLFGKLAPRVREAIAW